MRWDKWFEGLLYNILFAAALALVPFTADGYITSPEWIMLLGAALGGATFYAKNHPPVWEEEEEERRKNGGGA
jgi:hypothetical protein